jgi:diguanylate cyclase (GGDEF)-like protein
MIHAIIDSKRKIIFLLWVLLCIGFLATSIVSYLVSKNATRNAIIISELPLTADNIYSEIQKDLIRPIFISSMMASDTFVRDWVVSGEPDVARINRYLKEISKSYGTFSSFFVSEKTRNYYYADGVLKQVSEREPLDAWYFRLRGMQAPYEINVDHDATHANALTIFVNYRVFDYNRNFIGATGVGLTVHTVRSQIDNYQQRYQRNIYFVDRKGMIVMFGSDMQPLNSSIHQHPGLREISRQAMSQPAGAYEYRLNNEAILLNVRYIPELDWYLFVERNENDAVKSIRQTFYFNMFVFIIITGIALLFTGMAITRYQSRLELMATSDNLTGMPNRQAFDVVVSTYLNDARRNQESLSMLMLDIDHFKSINDLHGHLAGDQVLKAVADCLRTNLREVDFLCRWGGEEFLMVLKNCDAAHAFQVSEKLRLAIEMLVIEYRKELLHVTVSLGVSQWKPEEPVDALIDRTDGLLFHAKSAGRNRSLVA